MKFFLNFTDDATLTGFLQVTIPVSTVQLAYRQRRCVVIWSHLRILREKRPRTGGDSLVPFVKLCLTESFKMTLEVI